MKKSNEPIEGGAGCCLSPSLLRGVLLLQEKWILLIVHRLLRGSVGFNELNRQARGVCTTTLSQRLDLLEQEGLVVKTIHSTMPPRTSYELTEAGRALAPILESIEAWSEKYLAASEEPPLICTEAAGSEKQERPAVASQL